MVSRALTEAVLLSFTLLCVAGVWDGLVRKHIRYAVDVLDVNVSLRGVLAIIVGFASACFLLILLLAIGSQIRMVVAKCDSSVPCIAQTTLTPLAVTWQAGIIVVIALGLFVAWARGARDLRGPYRNRFLAPGVWDGEKALLELVASRLVAAHMDTIDDDKILAISSWIRQNIGLLTRNAPTVVTKHGELDVTRFVRTLMKTRSIQKFKLSEPVMSLVLTVVSEYYRGKYQAAARKWHWRRRTGY